QPLGLRHLHAAILLAPCVERRIADAVLAAQLRRRQSRLMLFQDADDLLFREPGSFHYPSPLSGNRLTSKRGLSRGAGHSFSIGGGASAHFENGSGATLNRVTGNLPSAIDGTLTATGCYRPLSDPDHRPGLFPADWRHRAMALSRCPQTCRAPARRLGFRDQPPSRKVRQPRTAVRLRARPAPDRRPPAAARIPSR